MNKTLEKLNSREGQNTRIHPAILQAVKTVAAKKGTTVWHEINLYVLAHLKRQKACPAGWKLEC